MVARAASTEGSKVVVSTIATSRNKTRAAAVISRIRTRAAVAGSRAAKVESISSADNGSSNNFPLGAAPGVFLLSPSQGSSTCTDRLVECRVGACCWSGAIAAPAKRRSESRDHGTAIVNRRNHPRPPHLRRRDDGVAHRPHHLRLEDARHQSTQTPAHGVDVPGRGNRGGGRRRHPDRTYSRHRCIVRFCGPDSADLVLVHILPRRRPRDVQYVPVAGSPADRPRWPMILWRRLGGRELCPPILATEQADQGRLDCEVRRSLLESP